MILRERDDGADLPVEPFDSTEIDVREPLRRELSRLDPPRELRHGRERDRLVRRRQPSGVCLRANELVARWPRRDAREHRVPEHGWRISWRDRHLAWPRAPLEVRRKRPPPRVGGLLPLRRRHRYLHQFLRLGEGRG